MDELEDTLSSDDSKNSNVATLKVKPKKRSLVERELETNLTARVTSPVTNGDGTSTSRYGRSRRLKTDTDFADTDKAVSKTLKSPQYEKIPVSVSPVYRMHASNSPARVESPVRLVSLETNLENQIENIYNANISLSRFASDEGKTSLSPAKKYPKLYVRKDLIQSKEKEKEETITLIKNLFSPVTSANKSNSHLSNILERSSEKYNLNGVTRQNGYLDTSSVVKALDFDGNKRKQKDGKDRESRTLSKSELFDLEAKCEYQVGDLAWARMGTYPFWPCIVTREPGTEMFVKTKLYGRIERNIIHVTYLGDNGRRSWSLDTMLRKFHGLQEFEAVREKFTPEEKKKDPRLYSAFFISEKKQTLWHKSVEEAELLLREPKRLRIDLLNDMLGKCKVTKGNHKSGKITRTDSDVSLSESLYDTLFSEDDGKAEDSERSRNKTRNKSLDVSEVVTACLDNMAAKTGLTKIQRQSHMDRWLQKAKSKTPEKLKVTVTVERLEKEDKDKQATRDKSRRKDRKKLAKECKRGMNSEVPTKKPYLFRRSLTESQTLQPHHNEHDYSTNYNMDKCYVKLNKHDIIVSSNDDKSVIAKVETVQDEVANSVSSENGECLESEFRDRKDNVNDNANDENHSENERNVTINGDIDNKSVVNELIKECECNDPISSEMVAHSTSLEHNNLSKPAQDEAINEIRGQENVIEEVTEPNLVTDLEHNKRVCKHDTVANVNENRVLVSPRDLNESCSTDLGMEEINVVKNGYMITESCPEPSESKEKSKKIRKNRLSLKRIETEADTSSISTSNEMSIDDESVQSDSNHFFDDSIDIDEPDRKSLQINVEKELHSSSMIESENNLICIINKSDAALCISNEEVDHNINKDTKAITDQLTNNFQITSIVTLNNDRDLNYPQIKDVTTLNGITDSHDKYDVFLKDATESLREKSLEESILDETVQAPQQDTPHSSKLEIKQELINEDLLIENGKSTENDDPSISDKTSSIVENTPEILVEPNVVAKYEDITIDGKPNVTQDYIAGDDVDDIETRKLPNVVKVKTESEMEINLNAENSSDEEIYSRTLRERVCKTKIKDKSIIKNPDEEIDPDCMSINSEDSEASLTRRRRPKDKQNNKVDETKHPDFLKYLEFRQDALIDEHPELTEDEIVAYLHKTWQYEENSKSDFKKSDDKEQSRLVKGLNESVNEKKNKRKTKPKKDKFLINIDNVFNKGSKNAVAEYKPKRKTSQPYYNEEYSDIEEEIKLFEIFKDDKDTEIKSDNDRVLEVAKTEAEVKREQPKQLQKDLFDAEEYFEQLTKPKPNIFKGLVREKVCEICESPSNLVKCKGCCNMFHVDCSKREVEVVEIPAPSRGRKKKKKHPGGRKPKVSTDSNGLDSGSQSDERSQDVSVSDEMSIEELPPNIEANMGAFEAHLEAKMKEILDAVETINYDSYSDDELDWSDTKPGSCKIVDVQLKPRSKPEDYSDFKCKECQEHETPLCYVCKSAVSPKDQIEQRQKCQFAHCNKYYHLGCLDHWPQTHFFSGEQSRSKKNDDVTQALTCPRHVCHTCVSDDPRGCKTRFSGDKLARCVRCPATYHSFTKCLPAGTTILTASQIICPRHHEQRTGKVSQYHVNTGWCFICALGGSLICCEYCPTSFHAECLNIIPPKGGYMCEDCETGRLPLYGEMVWVKLGHYRWWPGIVLHPSEIPDNILAVKHSLGEFVVRFFGQYDHYWVNRGRVFPFQEGDSGKISSQKSKIDEAFTKAMAHAHRAFSILKNVEANDEESIDIASSLLPPAYVKLKVNRPCGSLYGRRVDAEEGSLTQCECDPSVDDPCGVYSQCINRMLLTECGPLCRAGDRCNNRAFERRLYPRLAPYRTPHRGWGLKTLDPIRAGQFVIEYVGELIDMEEFHRRMRRMHEVRDENFYFLTLDKERMIDAGPKGNLARFMNHCCEPNCETQKWTVLGDIRVGLFAINDIPANSEVTFNYNLECSGIEKKTCLCGASRCSGYIGAKPKQDEPIKKAKFPAKRAYKKRKHIEESPSTSKGKPKRPVGRPAKPRELTDIEKDLLIIKNATNGISSDSEGSRLSSVDGDKNLKALKRKRVSFSEERSESPIVKKMKTDGGVGD